MEGVYKRNSFKILSTNYLKYWHSQYRVQKHFKFINKAYSSTRCPISVKVPKIIVFLYDYTPLIKFGFFV